MRSLARFVLFTALLLALAPSTVVAQSAAPNTHGVLGSFFQWLVALRAADGGYIDPAGFKEFTLPKDIVSPRIVRRGTPNWVADGSSGYTRSSRVPSTVAQRFVNRVVHRPH
jgi:hypothetical protein